MVEMIFNELNNNNKTLNLVKKTLYKKTKNDLLLAILSSISLYTMFRIVLNHEDRLAKIEKILLDNSKGE